MKYEQATQIEEIINSAKRIVIIQANNPDGDSLASSLACPAGNPIASLAPGKSVECKATLITTAKAVSAGKAVNHAEATGTFNETVITETDSSAVAIDKPSGPLALTGAAIASLLVLTAVLMGLGGVLTFAGRRRRRAR